MEVRRVRDRAEFDRILAVTEPLEPRSEFVDFALLLGPARGRRVYVAEEAGRLAGVLLINRRCLDRWGAMALLLDPAAAAMLAPIVDRSPARELWGFGVDVEPFVPHLRRARHIDTSTLFVMSDPVGTMLPQFDVVDPRARLATMEDLDALTKVYAGYELDDIPTMFQLRRWIRRQLRAGLDILVVEVDDKIVAAMRMAWKTRQYTYWSDLTVLPEARGQGFLWILYRFRNVLCGELGLGVTGEIQPSNPTDTNAVIQRLYGRAAHDHEEVITSALRLRTPVWFRGHGKLRKLWELIGGRRHRRPVPGPTGAHAES